MKLGLIFAPLLPLSPLFGVTSASDYPFLYLKEGSPEGDDSTLCKTKRHCLEFWGNFRNQTVQIAYNIDPCYGSEPDRVVYQALNLCLAPNKLPINFEYSINSAGLYKLPVDGPIIDCKTRSKICFEDSATTIVIKGLTASQCDLATVQLDTLIKHCEKDSKRIVAGLRKDERNAKIVIAIFVTGLVVGIVKIVRSYLNNKAAVRARTPAAQDP